MCWFSVNILIPFVAASFYYVHAPVCLSTPQGVCMIVGGIKHREQQFNSRSAGVGSALLFISIGGMSGICTFFKNNFSTNRENSRFVT